MTFRFDGFRLDTENGRLESDAGPIPLSLKAFSILRVLVERRGELVLKDQLLDEVWPDTHVADGVLKVRMGEIRQALGDSARQPRFIETVHRRGYRFIADVTVSGAEAWLPARSTSAPPISAGLVGRGRDLARLEERLARSLGGERQVVFITGEPGIGKTAVVEHFIAVAAQRHALATTSGQCLEHFGATEAYMPVLEAIGRLVRENQPALSLLRRTAPTWLAQFPWLIDERERQRLLRELLGTARERMLREMGEFVEAVTAQIPLILVLEDLHWSDPSTVDLVSLLAERREAARLLLLATYRPVELVLAQHPLRAVAQRLAARQRCREIPLDNLGAEAVAEYLERRFGESRFSPEVAYLLRERTDGNPLFMVALVDHLLAREAVVQRNGRYELAAGLRAELAAVPETLRLLISQQLERLAVEDREVLEGASLAGVEFSAAAAAAGADRGLLETEQRCERLAGAGLFLRHAGEARCPDGTVTGRYGFRHALYRETLATAVPPRRTAEVHRRIGQVLERAYGQQPSELGAELAVHFEAGGDAARAARYRRLAAETSRHRYAFAEAEAHLEKGLTLLGSLPASRERDRDELELQAALGSVRLATRGYGAPEVERTYERVLQLCSDTQQAAAFPALWVIWELHYVRAELGRALELAEQLRAIAEASDDRVMRLEAHQALWATCFFRGEFARALHHLAEGEPLYDPRDHAQFALGYGHDPKVSALYFRAGILWGLGHIGHALEIGREAAEYARSLGEPMSLGFAMLWSAWLRLCRREPTAAHEQAVATVAHATATGMPHWVAWGRKFNGCALVEQGSLAQGIAELEQGLALTASSVGGNTNGDTYMYATLAIAKARADRLTEAREIMERAKAMAAASGERYMEPDIKRLDAELVLAEAGGARRSSVEARRRAEALLRAAIEDARRQEARTLELRAATALADLCRGTEGSEARARLAALLDGFSEGFDTADLQDARRLLRRRAN